MAPNRSPLLNTSTLPVAGSSMPYRPLIGASSESTTMRGGVDVDLLVGAGDRRPVGVERVVAGRDDPGRERRDDDQREQDRVRRRQREPRLLGGSRVGVRSPTSAPVGPVVSRHGRSSDHQDAGPRSRRIAGPDRRPRVVRGAQRQEGDDRAATTITRHHPADRSRVASLRPPPTAGRAAAGTSCSGRRRGPCRARSLRSRPPRRRPRASWRSCRCCARRRRRRPARGRRRCCRRPTARAPAGMRRRRSRRRAASSTPRASATAPRKSSSTVTWKSPSLVPGRRLIARMLATTFG